MFKNLLKHITRRTTRPGSVLILVIALLVLLSLIGTAYISTSRIDRYTAKQNASNTQIDLLLQGVINTVKSDIVADIFDTSASPANFKGKAPQSPSHNTFQNWDSSQTDLWLSDRIPEQRDMTSVFNGYTAAGVANPASWNTISWPLVSDTTGPHFESPVTSLSPISPGWNAVWYPTIAASPSTPLSLVPTAWTTVPSYAPGAMVSYTSTYQTASGASITQTLYYQNQQIAAIPANNPPGGSVSPAPPSQWTQIEPKQSWHFEPTYVISATGQTIPAFNICNPTPGGNGLPLFPLIKNWTCIQAADADGDGIADSALWKLPVGQIDGISYYAAIRVVDNAALVNANTAASVNYDFAFDSATGAATPLAAVTVSPATTYFNPGVFPSNVGLMELINLKNPSIAAPEAGAEMNKLNIYRMNLNYLPAAVPAWPQLYGDDLTKPPTTDDTQTPQAQRNDFLYLAEGDELFQQLGRRLSNPGFDNYDSSKPQIAHSMQSLPFTDSLNLATQFCINNSEVGQTNLGQYLFNSLNGAANTNSSSASTPYSVTNFDTWFADNFWYGLPPYNTATSGNVGYPFYRPIRTLVTTNDPVCDTAPSQYPGIKITDPMPLAAPTNAVCQTAASQDMLPYSAATWLAGGPNNNGYNAGDWVQWPASQPKMYVAINTIAAADKASPDADAGNWLLVPWSSTTSKTNINTADFRELWRSYYQAMSDNSTFAPGTPPVNASSAPPVPAHQGQRMFKNSIRQYQAGLTSVPIPGSAPKDLVGTNGSMTDTEMLQLRAAIAAVNAEGLRKTNASPLDVHANDVLSRTVNLWALDQRAKIGAAQVNNPNANEYVQMRTVAVFSQQQQPFITEVMIHTGGGGAADYVAIELYNPYEQAVDATGKANGTTAPTFDMGNAAVDPIAPVGVRPYIHLGCQIGIMDRTSTTTAMTPVPFAWLATDVIPPGGYFVIEQGTKPSGVTIAAGIANHPVASELIPGTALLGLVPGGGATANKFELVLTRTHSADGKSRSALRTWPPVAPNIYEPDPIKQYDEGAVPTPDTLVPFEQFDCNGWVPVASSLYDYVRPTPSQGITPVPADNLEWRCVYPLAPAVCGVQGSYNPSGGGLMAGVAVALATNTGSLGAPDPAFGVTGTGAGTAGAQNDHAIQYWPPIQLNSVDWPGPGPVIPSTNTNPLTPTISFPFGGFYRLGDILQVPYIGAYRIYAPLPTSSPPPTAAILQANLEETMSVATDSVYAEDSDEDETGVTGTVPTPPPTTISPLATDNSDGITTATNDDGDEQIGRFCPLQDVHPRPAGIAPVTPGYYITPNPDLMKATLSDDYYWWAGRVFDYFCVSSPQDALAPMADPRTYPPMTPVQPPPASINSTTSTQAPYITYGTVTVSTSITDFDVSVNLLPINNLYNGCEIQFLTGQDAGQSMPILQYTYNPALLTHHIKIVGTAAGPPAVTAFTAAPAVGDTFRIIAVPQPNLASQGLVNINTASWKVLSMLPMVRDTNGALDNFSNNTGAPTYRNDSLARAIVWYRNQYGPFKSILDLNKVFDPTVTLNPATVDTAASSPLPGFQTGSADTFVNANQGNLYIDLRVPALGGGLTPPHVPTDARQGDYSPLEANTTIPPVYPPAFPVYTTSAAITPNDGVPRDFEKRFLAVSRISNLITTRSDSYTCYVLVQGWRNAGTASAQLVAQKRAAFIIDRSNISQTNLTPSISNVPVP